MENATESKNAPNDRTLLDQIKQSIVDGDREKCVEFVIQAVALSMAPGTILDDGLLPGIKEIGVLWDRMEIFLPEAVLAAGAMKGAMEIVIPLFALTGGDWKPKGVVVIGTVKGDLHDIGKTIVANILAANGYEVHDLGINVPPDRFLDAAQQFNADIICLSALMTTTMPMQKDVIDFVSATSERNDYIIMVGGALTTEEWSENVTADGWGRDAYQAVAKLDEIVAARAAPSISG